MPLTIMIVDDDADDRILFCEAVRQVDDSILCLQAEGSVTALDLLQGKKKPDFIFLDLNMPGINGRQFMRQLKTMPSVSNIPVIIYTTSTLGSDERELSGYLREYGSALWHTLLERYPTIGAAYRDAEATMPIAFVPARSLRSRTRTLLPFFPSRAAATSALMPLPTTI